MKVVCIRTSVRITDRSAGTLTKLRPCFVQITGPTSVDWNTLHIRWIGGSSDVAMPTKTPTAADILGLDHHI